MTPDAPGRPPRLVNLEVLNVRDDHTEDVSADCQCVMKTDKADIEARLFEDGNPQLAFMEDMVVEL